MAFITSVYLVEWCSSNAVCSCTRDNHFLSWLQDRLS